MNFHRTETNRTENWPRKGQLTYLIRLIWNTIGKTNSQITERISPPIPAKKREHAQSLILKDNKPMHICIIQAGVPNKENGMDR